jgi:hypothetical protein
MAATPITEFWNFEQVLSELLGQGGSNRPVETVI